MLSGSNQYSVSDKVICGGVKIQKRDLETKDTKAQGGASLKDTAFAIISLNDNAVLVDGKLYKKNAFWKIPFRRNQRTRGIFDRRCKSG